MYLTRKESKHRKQALGNTVWPSLTVTSVCMYFPPIPQLGMYPREASTYVHTQIHTWIFTAALFMIETTVCPQRVNGPRSCGAPTQWNIEQQRGHTRYWGISKAWHSVGEGSLRRLLMYIVWSHLHNILQGTKLWRQGWDQRLTRA